MGDLFQQYALFPNMTVLQNIQCGIRSGSRAEKRRRAEKELRRFRLEGLEKNYPAQLSGGQQQRTALARILVSEPRAILLDEPFSALDGVLKWNLELELSDLLSDFAGPILWVSHDLGECRRNCQTVCVMENGISGDITDMDTLLRRPATVGAARLTGNTNFLPAAACSGGVKLDGWNIVLPFEAEAEKATVVIPEGTVQLGEGSYAAGVERVIRDLNGSVVLLRPANGADAPFLRVRVPEETTIVQGSTVTFGLRTDKCLCYS